MKSKVASTLTISMSLGVLQGCDMPSVINLFSNNTATANITASGSVQVNDNKGGNGADATKSTDSEKLDKIVGKLDEIASKSVATPPPRLQSFKARGPKQYTEQSNDIATAFGKAYDALFPPVNIVRIVKEDKLGIVVQNSDQYGLFSYDQLSDTFAFVATVSLDVAIDHAKLFLAANEGMQDDTVITAYSEKTRNFSIGSEDKKGFFSLRLPSTWDSYNGSMSFLSLLCAVGKEMVFLANPKGGSPYVKDIKFIKPWVGDYQSSNLNKTFGGKITKVIFADGIFWYLVRIENTYSVWGATEQQIRQSQ